MIHTDDLMVDETLAVRRTKITEAKVEELAKSIVANGQLSPILVRRHPTEKGRYFIVAGETRVRAVEYANNKLRGLIDSRPGRSPPGCRQGRGHV